MQRHTKPNSTKQYYARHEECLERVRSELKTDERARPEGVPELSKKQTQRHKAICIKKAFESRKETS